MRSTLLTGRRRYSRSGAAAMLAMCVLAIACGRDAEEKSKDASDGMADMPGMNDGSAASAFVTFTPAQITHGRVKWEAPRQAVMAGAVEVPGQLVLNEDRTARLAASAQARVLAVHVSPGQRVTRGTRLVTLQSHEANMALADVAKATAELSSRRAAAAYAKAARDRADRLLALKAIPRQDYERAIADDQLAQADVAQAEAELQRARSNAAQLGVDLSDGSMTLRSPLAGVVTTRNAVPGAVVSAGDPLVTVTDPASLWLAVALPEGSVAGVRVGSSLGFAVASYPADTFRAVIQSVSATFDSATRSLPVRGVVSNSRSRLRPEMFARVWVEGGARSMAITVPDSALQRLDAKDVVFVAHPDGKGGARFEKRDVELGGRSAGWTAIVRGVRADEAVVVQGAFAVKAEFAKAKVPRMEMEK